jgi:hypothetical protein
VARDVGAVSLAWTSRVAEARGPDLPEAMTLAPAEAGDAVVMIPKPRLLDPSRTAPLVRSSCAEAANAELRAAPDDVAVSSVPDWVAEVGLVAVGSTYWLWASPSQTAPEPVVDDTPAPTVPAATPGQLILSVPPGRYMVDVFDTSSCEWFSRESCAASPLVAGLPAKGIPLVVRIQPMTDQP